MLRRLLSNNYIKIIFIWSFAIFIDYYFVINLDNPPDWDQGYHLSNTFKMFNIVFNNNLNINDKYSYILDVTDNYRGPLTYFLSSLFIRINNSYKFAYLSNHIFIGLTILSIYQLGLLFKNKNTGVWACIIFLFSPLVIQQRGVFLIDISLTSFSTLAILTMTLWDKSKKHLSLFGLLTGFSMGLIFLVKPTGIVIFIIPIIYILFKKYIKKENKIIFLYEFLIFFFGFLILIYPWFSKHWITIITSTLNAWKWGINYQEGLDANTIEGWLFYFKNIPDVIGSINFIALLIILVLNIFNRKKYNINLYKSNVNYLFILFILNFYFVASLMSTKDIRFILVIYPIICLYFATVIDKNIKNYFYQNLKNILFTSSIIFSLVFYIIIPFKKVNLLNNNNNWYHKEIISTIEKESPMLYSTLAILPDTKEINTFNLEAEAIRQGENVAVRQIVSNIETYKNDLKYFDWFLIKNGNQGVMTSKSKQLLSDYLKRNQSFFVFKKWTLPDNSEISLFRRKELNTKLSPNPTCENKNKNIYFEIIPNGLKLRLYAKKSLLESSKILLDLKKNEEVHKINIATGQGQIKSLKNEEECFLLSQNIPSDLEKISDSIIDANLLTKNNNLIKLKVHDHLSSKITDKNMNTKQEEFILMANKVDKVKELGIYLRNGNFDEIFNLIGVLNQSDPKQTYFKNAEYIFQERYKQKNEINYLYGILISQIIRREIDLANNTLDKIIKLENLNGNNYLTKAILNIYEFKLKEARVSINKLKYDDMYKSNQTLKISNYIDGLINIFEFKLYEGISKLS